MVELMVQISSSLLAKNVCSFTRFLQYPQTDLYQFFALSKRYIKEELSLIKATLCLLRSASDLQNVFSYVFSFRHNAHNHNQPFFSTT